MALPKPPAQVCGGLPPAPVGKTPTGFFHNLETIENNGVCFLEKARKIGNFFKRRFCFF